MFMYEINTYIQSALKKQRSESFGDRVKSGDNLEVAEADARKAAAKAVELEKAADTARNASHAAEVQLAKLTEREASAAADAKERRRETTAATKEAAAARAEAVAARAEATAARGEAQLKAAEVSVAACVAVCWPQPSPRFQV